MMMRGILLEHSLPGWPMMLGKYKGEEGAVKASVLQLPKYTHPHKDWGALQVDSSPIASLPT